MQNERFRSMPEINDLDNLSNAEKLALIAKWRSEVGGSIGVRAPQRKKSRPLLYLTDAEINSLFRAIDHAIERRPNWRIPDYPPRGSRAQTLPTRARLAAGAFVSQPKQTSNIQAPTGRVDEVLW